MATQVKDELMASDENFRRLAQEHTQYAQRLEALVTKRFLSEEEQIEETRLPEQSMAIGRQVGHEPDGSSSARSANFDFNVMHVIRVGRSMPLANLL